MAYIGWNKLKEALKKKKGIKNTDALLGSIEHKKYKSSDIVKHQQSGTSMKNVTPKKKFGY